jgi:adenosylmethionine-8-amino-7-oxononanoate aminotransferase
MATMEETNERPPSLLHAFARPAAPAGSYLVIESGQGAVVVDRAGNRYIDALASLWYCNIGHGRAEIGDAVAAQMRKLAGFHTFDRFTNPPVETLADQLVALAPMEAARVFLTSGGSESVETAIKLARLAHYLDGRPERTLVISRRPSYHGVTYAAMSATGLPPNHEGFGPLLGEIEQVPHDSLDALDELLARRGGQLAAIMAEPVIGTGGVYEPSPGYLAGLRERCDRHGAYLILDEVICGFGRLGTWWAAQHYGVRPDLVTFAKGVTSGYLPLGGVLVGRSVREPLEADPALMLRHGNTYSGHPSVCAAALANLDIIRAEGLVDRANRVGERLRAGLSSLVDGDTVREVRGDGAMLALGLGEGIDALAVREALLEQGVIARPIGNATLAYCPPLVISDAEIDRCVEATSEALTAVAKLRGD